MNYIKGIRILQLFSLSFHQENIMDWDNLSTRWNKNIHKWQTKVLAQDPWLTTLLNMGRTIEKEWKNRDCATSKICTPDNRKCFEVVQSLSQAYNDSTIESMKLKLIWSGENDSSVLSIWIKVWQVKVTVCQWRPEIIF